MKTARSNGRFGSDARRSLLQGIDVLSRAVSTTMGPGGGPVLVPGPDGRVVATRDGFAVSQQIFLQEPFSRQGAELLKQAATRVSDIWGDGSTTTIVLTAALLRWGVRLVEAGHDPVALSRDLKATGAGALAALGRAATPVETRYLRGLALAACGHEAIAGAVADAMADGPRGSVHVQRGRQLGLVVRHRQGFSFDRGLPDPAFALEEGRRLTIRSPVICLADLPIQSAADAATLIGRARWIGRPLVVFADAPGEAAQQVLLRNLRHGDLPVLAIGAPWKGPARYDFLEDLGAFTGATPLVPGLLTQLKKIPAKSLGTAERVEADLGSTTVLDGGGTVDAIANRLRQIDDQLQQTELHFQRQRLLERRGRLSGRSTILEVGGATDQEASDLRGRARSALASVRAAWQGGVVGGGGSALVQATADLGNGPAARGLATAAAEVFATILGNAGHPIAGMACLAAGADRAFDVTTGSWVGARQAGLVDAMPVVAAALATAISTASVALLTELIVLRVD
jgi:chaperonin GroEL